MGRHNHNMNKQIGQKQPWHMLGDVHCQSWVKCNRFDSPFLLILSINPCVLGSDRCFEKASRREEVIDGGHLSFPLYLEQCGITENSMNFQ